MDDGILKFCFLNYFIRAMRKYIFRTNVDSEGSDQTAHSRSLIWVFADLGLRWLLIESTEIVVLSKESV